MGKIFGILSGIGGAVLIGLVATNSATAIPEARLPSVRFLEDIRQPSSPSTQPHLAKPAAPGLEQPVVEPAKPEPAEPVVAEPSKPIGAEPAKPEPVKPVVAEPAKPEPVKPVVAEPAKPEPVKPVVAEPAKPAPGKVVGKPVAVAPAPKPTPVAKPAEPEPEEDGIGTLNVLSEPAGAAVFLDGVNVGQTPIELDVPAGAHKIRTVHPSDGTDRRQNVTVKANGTAKVEVAF